MSIFLKFIRCWLLISLLFEGLNAQSTSTVRQRIIIKHKDGSVFMGELLSKDSLQTVLLLSTGDTIHIPKRKISSVEKDVILYGNGTVHFTKGLFLGCSGGGSGVFDDVNTSALQLEFLAGYRANEKFSFALGFGTTRYRIPTSDFNFGSAIYLPVYAHYRYYPWKWQIRPYLFHQMGYGFGFDFSPFSDNRINGGIYLQPGVGIHFASRKNFQFLMSLSQNMQRGNGSVQASNFLNFGPTNPIVDYDLLLSRTILKFGLEFR